MNLNQKNIDDFYKTLIKIIEKKEKVKITYELKNKKNDIKNIKNDAIFTKKHI